MGADRCGKLLHAAPLIASICLISADLVEQQAGGPFSRAARGRRGDDWAHAVHLISALQCEYSLGDRNGESCKLLLRERGPKNSHDDRRAIHVSRAVISNMRATAVVRVCHTGATTAQVALAWLLQKEIAAEPKAVRKRWRSRADAALPIT